jgi:RimJ/RimL family protein N-acetyltransferase
MKLKTHHITLRDSEIVLRPMTEDDWDILLKWNSDPDVLYFSEGDDVASYSLPEIQGIYRGVSQSAFCFIIELNGEPIGEGWLQQMNIGRILNRYPGRDCRRIDLMIGEKQFWGRGFGTATIRALTRFGFEQQGADLVFACFVADYNPRSLKAFQNAGFEIVNEIKEPPGRKARYVYDLVISLKTWRGEYR